MSSILSVMDVVTYGNRRCILLLEDLDAAFTRGISRDESSTGAPSKATAPTKTEKDKDDSKDDSASTLSLSGLLNSLDGVAAAEGRYAFLMTTCLGPR